MPTPFKTTFKFEANTDYMILLEPWGFDIGIPSNTKFEVIFNSFVDILEVESVLISESSITLYDLIPDKIITMEPKRSVLWSRDWYFE